MWILCQGHRGSVTWAERGRNDSERVSTLGKHSSLWASSISSLVFMCVCKFADVCVCGCKCWTWIKENRCFSKLISVCWTGSKLSARDQKPREAEIKVKIQDCCFSFLSVRRGLFHLVSTLRNESECMWIFRGLLRAYLYIEPVMESC